ncbi:hypothetical protein GCM10022255_070970 [Dactylosporangium darangshiense]|uniref:Uncharacterized protein n=2 Tax=Dactylosporangium darangshiense TaxID=579108 RepID=A0ABP8DIF2_9ACTN
MWYPTVPFAAPSAAARCSTDTPHPAHRGVRALNAAIARDPSGEAVMLTVRDGVTLARRR